MSRRDRGEGASRPLIFQLFYIALAAILLRALYLWLYSTRLPFLDQPVLDAAFYDAWARKLLGGSWFPDGPFYHAPGYAWFLSLVYRVLGPEPSSAILIQALLGVGTTVATCLVAGRLFGRKEALLTGILMLGAGPLYFYESKLLVETLALFLVTLSILLMLRADENVPIAMTGGEAKAQERSRADGRLVPAANRRQGALALGAGLLAGLAAIVRPNLLLLPAALSVVLVFRASGHRRPWSTTLLYTLGWVVALLPTGLHNLSHGAPTPVATNGGFNFYAGNFRGARGIYEDPPGLTGVISTQESEADSLVVRELGRVLPPGPESGYWTSRGLKEIADDVPGWTLLIGRKAWLFVNRQEEEVNGSPGLEASRIPLLRVLAFPFSFFVFAGVAGLLVASGFRGRRRSARAPLVAPVLLIGSVFVTALVFFVMARLRLAALPMLAVFASHALARVDLAWKGGNRKAILAWLLAGLLFMALTWRSPLGPARDARWESRLFLETGRGLETRGRKDAALGAYDEAILADPRNVDAYLLKGQMALENRDLSGAIREFEEARRAAPDNVTVRNNLGILYYQARRFRDADQEMVAAIRLAPSAAGPWFYRGLVAKELGDVPGAEQFFADALERDPQFTGAYVRLIQSLLDRGDGDGARRWADQAAGRAVALPPELSARLR